MTYSDLLQRALDQRLPMVKALELLRGSGASPIEAVDAVAQVTGSPREAARDLVTASRAWSAPRSGMSLGAGSRDGYGAIGQHGRSGQGAASVLPHLARHSQLRAGTARAPRR